MLIRWALWRLMGDLRLQKGHFPLRFAWVRLFCWLCLIDNQWYVPTIKCSLRLPPEINFFFFERDLNCGAWRVVVSSRLHRETYENWKGNSIFSTVRGAARKPLLGVKGSRSNDWYVSVSIQTYRSASSAKITIAEPNSGSSMHSKYLLTSFLYRIVPLEMNATKVAQKKKRARLPVNYLEKKQRNRWKCQYIYLTWELRTAINQGNLERHLHQLIQQVFYMFSTNTFFGGGHSSS